MFNAGDAFHYERQREGALRLGADEVVRPKETYKRLPGLPGAKAHEPDL